LIQRYVRKSNDAKIRAILSSSLLPTISLPEYSFLITGGQKTRDSGSNHFEITKEITEFGPSGFTAQSVSMRMPEMVGLSFSDRWSRERKYWERDCVTERTQLNVAFAQLLEKLTPIAFPETC